jgi:hypothetical protein
MKVDEQGNGAVWIYDLSGASAIRRLTFDRADYPVWTRDGQRVIFQSYTAGNVYTSNESGRSEIYVQPFPPVSGVKYQITTMGGFAPLWSPDGKRIFYLGPSCGGPSPSLISVDVRTQPTFAFANPAKLPVVILSLRPGGNIRSYDITPDGKQFLILTSSSESSEKPAQLQLRITLNWTEELKQRVPVK